MVPNLSAGVCAGTDDPRWLAEPDTRPAWEAKKACADCPVLQQCLDYALKVGVWGVWGGTTLPERQRLRKKLGIVVEPVLPPNLFSDAWSRDQWTEGEIRRGTCEYTERPAVQSCSGPVVGRGPECKPCNNWRRYQTYLRRVAA